MQYKSGRIRGEWLLHHHYTIGVSVRFVQQTWLLLVLGGISAADTVKLLNKPAFRNVTISDFRADRLVFRGVSQQYLQKPLDEVEWLAIEGRPELNSAEQAAATGQWAEAVAGYQRALASLSEPWLRELVRMRLLNACRPAGAFDLAVATYADLLGSRPALPAPLRICGGMMSA